MFVLPGTIVMFCFACEERATLECGAYTVKTDGVCTAEP